MKIKCENTVFLTQTIATTQRRKTMGKGHNSWNQGYVCIILNSPNLSSFSLKSMKSIQVTLMLAWDWCKMLNTNIPMIFKSCVPYPRSTSLREVIHKCMCYIVNFFNVKKIQVNNFQFSSPSLKKCRKYAIGHMGMYSTWTDLFNKKCDRSSIIDQFPVSHRSVNSIH